MDWNRKYCETFLVLVIGHWLLVIGYWLLVIRDLEYIIF
jgi:hypothetical protein